MDKHNRIARAAVAAGVDGIFVEVHEDPAKALSDGANALRLDLLADLLGSLRRIHEAAGAGGSSTVR